LRLIIFATDIDANMNMVMETGIHITHMDIDVDTSIRVWTKNFVLAFLQNFAKISMHFRENLAKKFAKMVFADEKINFCVVFQTSICTFRIKMAF